MKDLKQEPEEKVQKTSPCVICLGLVQDQFIKECVTDEVCITCPTSVYLC